MKNKTNKKKIEVPEDIKQLIISNNKFTLDKIKALEDYAIVDKSLLFVIQQIKEDIDLIPTIEVGLSRLSKYKASRDIERLKGNLWSLKKALIKKYERLFVDFLELTEMSNGIQKGGAQDGKK